MEAVAEARGLGLSSGQPGPLWSAMLMNRPNHSRAIR